MPGSLLKMRRSQIRQAIAELAMDAIGDAALTWMPERPFYETLQLPPEEEEPLTATPRYLFVSTACRTLCLWSSVFLQFKKFHLTGSSSFCDLLAAQASYLFPLVHLPVDYDSVHSTSNTVSLRNSGTVMLGPS
jgi:hypothetical protein